MERIAPGGAAEHDNRPSRGPASRAAAAETERGTPLANGQGTGERGQGTARVGAPRPASPTWDGERSGRVYPPGGEFGPLYPVP